MDKMFKIDKDVEIPLASHGLEWPFTQMEVGHSFMVPKHLNIGTVRQAARRYGMANKVSVEDQSGVSIERDRVFIIQSMGDHHRCWRKQ